MKEQELIAMYWEGDKFSDLFIQMFVGYNGTLDINFLNQMFETKLTYSEVLDIILSISGSKYIAYRDVEEDTGKVLTALSKDYEFAKFKDATYWVYHLYEEYGIVGNRNTILGWISRQHPDKAVSSFVPTGMVYREPTED